MLFNSFQYLVFFPIVTILYFVFPKKYNWLWLLLCSYYFYMSWDAKYAGLMLLSTVITYFSGIALDCFHERPFHKKVTVAVSFLSNLSILFFFKYFNFFNTLMSSLSSHFSFTWGVKDFNVLLPVGISFYTFQALSYTMDVYRNQIKAEKHFGKYALFVSFFPQLVAGPIERSANLLPQMHRSRKFTYPRLTSGLIMIVWGLFKKIVIADRVAILVNTVYNNFSYYQGFTYVVATVFFAIQIYCDFSGYSDIAIGSARILGFELMTNFKQPYFSKSIAEFWRRWHISLGGWFRDNLYIPLGGNRVPKWRRYLNLLVVFLVSGLWHGASLSYVIWGGLHGVYQIIGLLTRKIKVKVLCLFQTDVDNFGFKFGQMCCTFLLTCFGWIFFRANRLLDALYIVKNLFVFNYWVFFDDSLFRLGLSWKEFMVAIFSIIILIVVDFLSEKFGDVPSIIKNQNLVFRWVVYLVFIFWILIFGSYGGRYNANDFIYFQF